MNYFFDEGYSLQEPAYFIGDFELEMVPLTAKIYSTPFTCGQLSQESDDYQIYEKQNQELRLTPSFPHETLLSFKTNFIGNSFNPFQCEEIDSNQNLNEFLRSSKSCLLKVQINTFDDQSTFLKVKPTEIEPNLVSYENQSRKAKVERYLLKKKKRIFKKFTRYACRKKVADSRIRKGGRFQKESEPLFNTSIPEKNFVNDSQKSPKSKTCKQRQNTQRNAKNQQNGACDKMQPSKSNL